MSSVFCLLSLLCLISTSIIPQCLTVSDIPIPDDYSSIRIQGCLSSVRVKKVWAGRRWLRCLTDNVAIPDLHLVIRY